MAWQLPPALQEILSALRPAGRPLLVGGCVRDHLLGREPKDFDVEVYGVSPEQLQRLLAPFGSTDPVGKSFGVLKVRADGVEFDFALPRRETKTGSGHRGFVVGVDPELPVDVALARRDFTINSIAWDAATGELIDPHGGAEDLRLRRLRHTSAAFVEDPLRVLRGMQFAARFELSIAAETAAISAQIAGSFVELSTERVWAEWQKWAENSVRPSLGLRALQACGWIGHFPEVAALQHVPQDPTWHPEGDVFEHTCHCVDALAALPEWRAAPASIRRDVMLAVLGHDFGKPSTTAKAARDGVMRWVSPGHEPAGGPLIEQFLTRLGAPKDVAPVARKLVENHMAHLGWRVESGPNSSQVRRLARRLAPATVGQLLMVLQADHLGRPPRRDPATARRIGQLAAASAQLALADHAPRPILLGRHLLERGLEPGPRFREILDEAFEAQLDGAFNDESGARVWLMERMNHSNRSGR